MAVSRRNFLGSSVAAALACASAPLAALAARRLLPCDADDRTDGRTGAGTSGIAGRGPETPEQRYAHLADLTRDSFQSAIGSPFRVSATSRRGGAFWLRLLSVSDLQALVAVNPASMAVPPPRSALQPPPTAGFELSFSGGPIRNLRQDTYFFQHSELGQFALFIVPAGPQQYTAIVNRLVTKTAIPV